MMNTDKLFNNDANNQIGMMETMYRILSHITEEGLPLMDPAIYDKQNESSDTKHTEEEK